MVTDLEFEEARQNEINRKIIGKILVKYQGLADKDQLKACGDKGLWMALTRHRPDRGGKWTSSLHRWVTWEVQKEIQRNRGKATLCFDEEIEDYAENIKSEAFEFVMDLPEKEKELLNLYYLSGYKKKEIAEMYGMSPVRISQKFKKIMKKLKKLI